MASDELRLFDPTFYRLEAAMRRRAMIQAIISHNVANANTPGYKPLRFDEVLNEVVRGSESVDLEREMADMAKNSTEYSAYIRLLNAKFSALRSVVTQGRK